jgi:subfamily B ATP-binding cassette protein MsbA
LQETISSIKIVKSYSRENFEKEKFRNKTKESYDFSLRSVFLVALLKPTNEIISVGGMVLVFMILGLKLINGGLLIGDLTMFIAFLTMSYKPIKTLGEVTEAIEKATVSAERIFEIFDTQIEPIKKVKTSTILKDVKGDVVFENVAFSYSGSESILHDINLTAKSGETIAFVGPSGGGKSTIINILMRFYEINSGRILIDNLNISHVTLDSLRSNISLVPQETILFSGTVLENIKYGNLAVSVDEVISAAKKANADLFIQNLPKKYDTEIGERGIQLSGGQRQRIAIARAILKNPKILLLDEATSALDVESENLVQEALENLMIGRTTFVIAHRLSTILNADRIYVIDKGKIIQSGNHNELINSHGLYRRLYSMQFKENKHK